VPCTPDFIESGNRAHHNHIRNLNAATPVPEPVRLHQTYGQ
jgi:hypothetical protein